MNTVSRTEQSEHLLGLVWSAIHKFIFERTHFHYITPSITDRIGGSCDQTTNFILTNFTLRDNLNFNIL